MLPLRVECENIHHTPNSPLSAPGGKSDNTTPTHVAESNFSRDMCWGTLTLHRQHRALTFIVNPSTFFLFLPLGQIRIQHIHNTCSRVGLQPPHVLARTKQEFVTQLGATHAPAAPHDSTQHTLPLSAPGGKSEDNTVTTHEAESNISRYTCWLADRSASTPPRPHAHTLPLSAQGENQKTTHIATHAAEANISRHIRWRALRQEYRTQNTTQHRNMTQNTERNTRHTQNIPQPNPYISGQSTCVYTAAIPTRRGINPKRETNAQAARP